MVFTDTSTPITDSTSFEGLELKKAKQLAMASVIDEIIIDQKHRHPWAFCLSNQAGRVLIRMNESTWRDRPQQPIYDIFAGKDGQGYITWLPISLGVNGEVLAEKTISDIHVKDRRDQEYPFVKELLVKWIGELDGVRFDSSLVASLPVLEVDIPYGPGTPIYMPGTYGNRSRLVSFDAPVADPNSLAMPARIEQENTLVFYGGLGAVVPRFYQEYLNEFSQGAGIKLVAVDLLEPEAALAKIKDLDLPYEEYFHARDFKIDRKNPPAGMVVLTRPDSHYPITEMANTAGVPVYLEKPLVVPAHLKEVLELYKSHRDALFAIDFFFDNPLVMSAMKLIKEGRIGRIQGFEGEMIEEQTVEPGREWLTNPEVSGGGLGMDMMVHLTALSEMLLERWGYSIQDAVINPENLIFARYQGAPEGTETFAQLEGRIGGSINFKLGAGKGLNTSKYYLVVHGDRGSIEINLGTEDIKGFVKLDAIDGNDYFEENSDTDIGYRGTVKKILGSTGNPTFVSQAERDFRVNATWHSVRLLDIARYMFGDNYYQIEPGARPSDIIPDPDRAMSVDDRHISQIDAAENLIIGLKKDFDSRQLLVDGKLLSVTRHFWVELGGEACAFIHPEFKGQPSVNLFTYGPLLQGEGRTRVLEELQQAVEQLGWRWGGVID